MPSPQYQLPQNPPPQQPTSQLLNTNPAGMMHPDKAMASLAFSTHLLNQLLQHHAPQQEQESRPQQEQQENPQEEAQETPEQEKQEQPDTSGLDQKIADLQASHEKEIMMLKHELEVQGIKQGNDKKITEIEKKHQQEIEDLKNTVKSIINAES